MKTLVLSDIHSNIYALEAVWAKEHDADLVLCCGDLVDYGPKPREVLDWARAHGALCVQGNHDAWVPLAYRQGRTYDSLPESERGWENLTAGLLEESDIEYLEQLPRWRTVELDGATYGMIHIYNECREIVSLHGYRQFITDG